jgi:hypothetical protein
MVHDPAQRVILRAHINYNGMLSVCVKMGVLMMPLGFKQRVGPDLTSVAPDKAH